MNSIFNSPFEISLRVIIILSEYEDSYLSADMITAIDFMSIYSNAFGLADTNLHGDNPFKFSELASRRELVQIALKELVANGFISVNSSKNGFMYFITNNGLRYSDSFESKYANTLREMVFKVREYTAHQSEKDVVNRINTVFFRSLKGGGN
ncbi:MAG TPA: ABC-three component system middle component 2 [Cerasibacillus sp.]|uniref:ABC-three component system middle component 2 n=1 Tax=Cerasibacillus sp. TaxID=2498711 RepID=UPI002F3FEA6D